jgi:hypothetical protein
LAAVVLVALALLGVELASGSSRLTIRPNPAGLELDQFGARSLQSGWWYDREGVSYSAIGNPRTSVSASISTYDLVAFRFLLGYLELKPAPSFPNFELRIDSPELDGVGYGDDTIQCGDGQPDSCSAWIYWTIRGDQIVSVTAYVDLFEGHMSESEFRDLVRSILVVEQL